jgi:hypothetical protein
MHVLSSYTHVQLLIFPTYFILTINFSHCYLLIMHNDPAVAYSFVLYTLYVCLPLVPAVLIFRLFPDSKVSVSGPLQNFTVNATGAFAAYIVTVALGFFIVRYVESQINSTRLYAVEGVFLDLGKNQYVGSDHFYSQYAPVGIDPSQMPLSRNYNFVYLLDHPISASETVFLQYWDITAVGGLGMPASKSVRLTLKESSSEQHFRLQVNGNEVTAIQVAEDKPVLRTTFEVAMEGTLHAH